MKRIAFALTVLAASCTPALAHVAPWSSPDPPPLPVQFLIGIALMAGAGAVIVWHGAALAREALARAGAPPRTPSRAPERLRFPAVRIAPTPRRPAPIWGCNVRMLPADAVRHHRPAVRAPRCIGPMSAPQAAVAAAS
jgi:hypothetical protein